MKNLKFQHLCPEFNGHKPSIASQFLLQVPEDPRDTKEKLLGSFSQIFLTE